MSSIPLVSESSAVSANDPRLTEPQVDYSVIHYNQDGSPYIADRYLSLTEPIKRYILALALLGAVDLAQRVGTCCRSGHVSKRCRKGHYARAHRHHCGDPFCPNCTKPHYRLYLWARKRDHAIFHTPHEAMEIRWRREVSKNTRHYFLLSELAAKALPFLNALAPSTLTVLSPAPSRKDCGLRVLFPAEGVTHTFSQLNKLLTDLKLNQELIVTVKRGTTEEMFRWAFSAYYECACMEPETKAQFIIDKRGRHIIRTTGSFYCKLPESEWDRAPEPCLCPVCKEDDLETIAPENWHVEPIEDIVSAYEHVEWAGDSAALFQVRNSSPTNNATRDYRIPSTSSSVAASPPPW